jgi:hypothetical protein
VLGCLGAVLVAGYRLSLLLESPSDIIRIELEAAAAEMRAPIRREPSPAVLAAMRRDFSEQDVSIAKIPASATVAVTLHGIDHETCVAAAAKLRRINGSAVVMLQGYPAPEDCGRRNDMTWWIMP